MYEKEFVVTHDHLKLLQRMDVSWQDCEYGAPEINPKRPYGNSSVEMDIAEILGWELPDDDWDFPNDLRYRAAKIHQETLTVIQILLQNLHVYPGLYRHGPHWNDNWTFVGVDLDREA